MNYKQCQLNKGTRVLVTWLPENYAKVGKVLKLKDDDGWVVREVWATTTKKDVTDKEWDHKRWAVGRGLK